MNIYRNILLQGDNEGLDPHVKNLLYEVKNYKVLVRHLLIRMQLLTLWLRSVFLLIRYHCHLQNP